MQLNNEQQKDLLAFVHKTWPETATCPVCRHNEWAIRSRLFEVGEYRETMAKSAHHAGLPVVALTCESCGYVLLLDAAKAGVVKKPTKG